MAGSSLSLKPKWLQSELELRSKSLGAMSPVRNLVRLAESTICQAQKVPELPEKVRAASKPC